MIDMTVNFYTALSLLLKLSDWGSGVGIDGREGQTI